MEQQQMNTQTILSDNNQIQLILNLIIEQTAVSQNDYEGRINLIDALHLAIFNSLTKQEDKTINEYKNQVVMGINKLRQINPKVDGNIFAQQNMMVHTNMDMLNKQIFGIAHKILNSPYKGKIKW